MVKDDVKSCHSEKSGLHGVRWNKKESSGILLPLSAKNVRFLILKLAKPSLASGRDKKQKISRIFQNFQSIWISNRKIARVSRNVSKCTKTFQIIWKLSTVSENVPEHRETIQSIWKLSSVPKNFRGSGNYLRESGNFYQGSENFSEHSLVCQNIQKLFSVSGNFSECPESFP